MDKPELIATLNGLQRALAITQQAELARMAGAKQQSVSLWLDPKSPTMPSAEAFGRLGKAAIVRGREGDAIRFWKAAGLSESEIISLLMLADSGGRIGFDETIKLMRMADSGEVVTFRQGRLVNIIPKELVIGSTAQNYIWRRRLDHSSQRNQELALREATKIENNIREKAIAYCKRNGVRAVHITDLYPRPKTTKAPGGNPRKRGK